MGRTRTATHVHSAGQYRCEEVGQGVSLLFKEARVLHLACHVSSVLSQVRMDGSDGCTDLRMSIPDSSGCFVRTTAKRDGSLLLIGELHHCLRVI